MKSLTDFSFIDIHYHANPDLYIRRWDALETGRIYHRMNGAVFLKSHLGSTGIQATLAQKLGLPVFPSLVLNHIAGGINYRVIIQALSEYQSQIPVKMIVHFPTITGRHFKSKLSRTMFCPSLAKSTNKGQTLFDNHHQLSSQVIDILKMAKDYPIVLSTGHASKAEVYSLIDACIQHHVGALLLNQPANPLTGLNAMELQELSKNEWVWTEQTALTYLLGHQDKDDFSLVLKTVPRVIYSSDLGQTTQIDVNAWYQFSQVFFQEIGLTVQQTENITRSNAIQLLGIDKT